MKALVYKRFGSPEVLEWSDGWPQPDVGTNDVLVKFAAGSVNPKDILLRKGKFGLLAREPLPRITGHDIAGVVVEHGAGVNGLDRGDAVYGMSPLMHGGIISEYALLTGDTVARAPKNLTPVEAAAVPLAALTALQALRDLGRVSAGSRVLINGATGGVGHFAVQIAKALGARVTGTCSTSNLEFLTELGADEAVDYKLCPAPRIKQKFDVVFDVFGKYSARDFKTVLGKTGIYINTIPSGPRTLLGEGLARLGGGRRNRLVVVQSRRTDLVTLRGWIESGQLKPHIDKQVSVHEAAEAHRHVETKHTRGKVVIALDAA